MIEPDSIAVRGLLADDEVRNANHARSRERLCEAVAGVGYEVEAYEISNPLPL